MSVDSVTNDGGGAAFEGMEKRIELTFSSVNLRKMTRGDIDDILIAAKCSILMHRYLESYDAYILSESSMFIYDDHIIMLTCGSTSLFLAIRVILDKVAKLPHSDGLVATCTGCEFSRGAYVFPEKQEFPHRSFDEETDFLTGMFGCCESLTDTSNDQFTWSFRHTPSKNRKTMCWQNMALSACYQKDIITAILPYIDSFDQFNFTPCGYSMNGYKGGGYVTVHVTPQAKCSYASVEVMGIDVFDWERICTVFDPKPLPKKWQWNLFWNSSFYQPTKPIIL